MVKEERKRDIHSEKPKAEEARLSRQQHFQEESESCLRIWSGRVRIVVRRVGRARLSTGTRTADKRHSDLV